MFVDRLPDEKALFRDICIELNEVNHESFQNFIKSLPMGLQNLVRNKIMLYKETPGTTRTKMRTIYKVRAPAEFQK